MARFTECCVCRPHGGGAFHRHLAVLSIACSLAGIGCEPATEPGTSSPETAPSSTATSSATAEPAAEPGRRGYEIPIPQLEYWAGTTVPKYRYEMRFDPPETPGGTPRLHRNGWAWAYYANGQLERQGSYRFVAANDRAERVGVWTYYTQSGDVDRTEDRGGEVVWTAPDQRIAPPGTTP